MADSYVLYEHAAGYGLFAAKSFDEIGSHQQELEASIKDLSRFNSCVHLVGFLPFKTGVVALSNANAISEGLVTEELKVFLDSNLPAKRKQVTMGVSDSKIGAAIAEELKISCKHGAQVLEVIRGIRLHFHKMLKGLSAEASFKAQLGLGHSYSRAKVKFNVNKSDNMIIQSIALLDQLDKDINTFSMRIREWYSYHFPELIKIVPNNYMFARCTLIIRDREKIDADKVLPQLEEIIMDSAKAQAIIDATKSSMGMEISALDLINIERFANRVVALSDYRMSLQNYLAEKMKQVAPNLGELIGDTVAARLISHAGSLTNLAKYPASTVQILGAEKALFRALKTRGNTPKYGLLFHSTFIGRAGVKNKGRISRYLANKCSLASRIDCFSEEASSVFGQKLREQVEDRLKFYESGDVPKKNVDVMKEATEENQALLAKKARKKMRKEMKISKEGQAQVEQEASGNGVVVKEKKKKKRKLADDSLTAEGVTDNGVSHINGEGDAPVKKKKNKKNKEIEMELN